MDFHGVRDLFFSNCSIYGFYVSRLAPISTLLPCSALFGFLYSYIDDFHREREYHSNCNAIFIEKYKKFNIMVLVDRCWKFYRFVSEKEYNSKIRDKFNENVLQTILKKLINDDFKW